MNDFSPRRGGSMGAGDSPRFARLKARLFAPTLARIDAGLEAGMIEVHLPDGSFRILGGKAPGPVARVTLVHWRALLRMARSGSVGWFDAWDKGEWKSADPVALFELVMRNRLSLGSTARSTGFSRLAGRISHALRRNSRKGAKRNILAHYDLGNDFYASWLDQTMTYSSALFARPMNGEEALENAQKRKVQAIGRRLNLAPGSTVLEIGCGWGYFSRLCAAKGHAVTALSLSPAQLGWAQDQSKDMANPPLWLEQDYRDAQGQYDAIASIEMVEAVGMAYWPSYLDAIARLLKPGGRAAIQYIAIADDVFESYAKGADFIQTFIFPGGMLLSESRFRALAEARGLIWEDQQNFGADYAETLRRWRVRFDAAVEEGRLPQGFDARFVRLWRYYLMYCEGGFKGGGIHAAQVTLVKPA